MAGRGFVEFVLVAVCVFSVTTVIEATVTGTSVGSSHVLDLSKGGYKLDVLSHNELLKHGDASQWEEINVSGNSIDEIEYNTFFGFENLKKLSLASNSLSTIEDNLFRDTKLSLLDISSNVLVAIRADGFTGLNELRELNLANNLMKPFKPNTFKDTTNLIKINLGNNPRVKGLFKNVTIPSLEELNLESCGISDINTMNFENMPNLKAVNLEGNFIHDLGEGTFESNPKFKDLNLRQNGLNYLRDSTLRKMFSPNCNIVMHLDYDSDMCLDCSLNPCPNEEELQSFICASPTKTSGHRVYEWKNEEKNLTVILMVH